MGRVSLIGGNTQKIQKQAFLMRTQVGIIGAGPAGLVLAHLLKERGIESVILESRSRTYVESRIRAGVLEYGTVKILDELGLSDRLHAEGLVHDGIELGFDRERHRIDFRTLTGRSVTVYGQHEVVRDLISVAQQRGIPIHFDITDASPRGFDSNTPTITYTRGGDQEVLKCDFIAGCDGFHGVSRATIPAKGKNELNKAFPYAWLGILVEAPPSQKELVYMNSQSGFALFSMRSPTVTRLYLQCDDGEVVGNWSDDRIWQELFLRFTCDDGWRPNEGPILQKSITPMRSVVVEPMQYRRLFLAGDAVHIVPPTGAKGMNLAIADVKVLSEGFAEYYRRGTTKVLDRYSTICLRRVWNAQRFSGWMTSMLHRDPNASSFEHRRQLAELAYVTTSCAASTMLAENYVGLPIELA
jgi:p-hydroxybenzoate 3-monooxygenase